MSSLAYRGPLRWIIDHTGTGEIGCWLEPAAERRVLITAASRMLLTYTFEKRRLHRAEWRCRADNAHNSAVAERVGMTLEGVMREVWMANGVIHDKRCWSVLADDYGVAHGGSAIRRAGRPTKN